VAVATGAVGGTGTWTQARVLPEKHQLPLLLDVGPWEPHTHTIPMDKVRVLAQGAAASYLHALGTAFEPAAQRSNWVVDEGVNEALLLGGKDKNGNW
jgi:hypothetical protein